MPLIVLEGPDGVGKSTQCRRLGDRLAREFGVEVVQLREPTDGPWGRKIREAANTDTRPDAETETRWFEEDRKQDVAQNIQPALDRGAVVILDRYFFSTAAYQGARGVPVDRILRDNRAFAPEPDLCLVMLGDVEASLKRITSTRQLTHDAFETAQYQLRVKAIFEELLASEGAHLIRIDADPAPDVVEAAIWQAVTERLSF